MARKLRVQFPGAVYHVTFRGNSRAPIFGDDADHIRLTERVAEMVKSPIAIGDEEFVRRVESQYAVLIASGKRREDVVLRRCRKLEPVESVITDVCRKLGVDEANVFRSRRDGTERGMVAFSLIRRCGLTQRDAAERLGLTSGSAVSYLVRKVKASAKHDSSVRQQIEDRTR